MRCSGVVKSEYQKSETAWRNLSVHVQQRHPHRRIGKRQQVRFPVCEECGVAQCQITTKDAFWEVENVTIYDSELNGEYLGWHSHNLRLVNCHITGEQPLCYAHDLVLENCTFGPDCDRAFEYSSVQATIKGTIGGVKNPRTGCITAESYGEIILDENIKAPADCELRLWDGNWIYKL